MKIYCFIKDNMIGVYDRANWKEQGKEIRLTPLTNSLGVDEVQEFIKYVKTKHEPTYNPDLDIHPDTYMYEIDL